jgi:catechol 2,3-dioxygenase-like lactoylglutathione lyase family enzyme
MPIEVLGVEHIDLTVNDVPRSRAFYDKVLGELGFRKHEDENYLNWSNALMTIAIRAASDTHRGADFDRYRVGLHHLALRARSRADVDQFHRFLDRERSPSSILPLSIRSMDASTTPYFSPIPTG